MHGWAIAQRIRLLSQDVLQVQQGSLYPALHKLEHQGFIKSEWDTSDNNRRAKYYTLTRAGQKRLAHELESWERLSAAITMAWLRALYAAARTAIEPTATMPGIRSAMRTLDSSLPLVNVRTLDEVASESTAERRLETSLLAGFGVMALVLAACALPARRAMRTDPLIALRRD